MLPAIKTLAAVGEWQVPLWMRYVAVVLLATTLAGCASTDSYVAPEAKDSPTIAGYKVERGLFDWEHYSVEAIDDKRVPQHLFSGPIVPADRTYALAPGTHKLLVRGFFNRVRGGGGPYETYVVVVAEFVARTAYQLRAEVADNLVHVWVTEVSTGKSVSVTSAEPFHVFRGDADPSFVFLPMFRW